MRELQSNGWNILEKRKQKDEAVILDNLLDAHALIKARKNIQGRLNNYILRH